MLPPPGLQMAPDSTWQPSRKLVPLQKGCNPNEPFKVNILCRENKDYENYNEGNDNFNTVSVGSTQEQSNPKLEGELRDLKEINKELYTFSLKNILERDM